ncbi:SDR family oxidoreductase [Roseovarius sp. 2305UL8-3]|uniref:SDR family oxidoreductase n=1 Tax=Roseovarius conchicola TaxID=3121636 RepID=UPI003526E1AA
MSDALFDLSGRTALVTGGTRGIGEMIAKGFLERGARVYITSRKADACAAMQAKLSQYGDCIAQPSDLSSIEGVSALADWLSSEIKSLDILVNNAGAAWGEPLETFSEPGWDRVMDLNVKGVFFLTQKMLPLLREAAEQNRPAKIINVGSIEGFVRPFEIDSYAYPASKAAVHHLTRILAGRLAIDNITVNAIAPGPFESKMTAYALATDHGRASVAQRIPLQRIGHDTDMAGLTVFLASRASDFVTGVTIPLDGGYVNLR